MGLNLQELAALSATELTAKLETAHKTLADASAHYVINGIDELPTVLDKINQRLAAGERP